MNSVNQRERFLKAVEGKPTDCPPVWMMRQAGRYLPEYRAIKQAHDFLTVVKTPDLAAEVTLQPLNRFDFDAAIIFSDILVIPEALGQPYYFKPKGGISVEYLLDSREKIEALDNERVYDHLQYVAQSLRKVREIIGLKKALIGFGGSPWTLATYMVEGGSAKNFEKIKYLYFSDHASFERLMEKLVKALITYFKLQIEAGVDVLQIFDSWGHLCQGTRYWDMSLRWIKQIIEGVEGKVPVIFYGKHMSHHLDLIKATGAKVFSVDWTVDLARLQQQTRPLGLGLQGNIDPVLLSTVPDRVYQETAALVRSMQPYEGFILNLGHGILPSARIENVQAFLEAARNPYAR